jgi:ABC-type branched-chain amino acid transport systems, ATPase component
MLAIGRALLLNPKLLLLDEPSQGLAPLIVQEVFRVIADMRNLGMSLLLVEQNVRAAVEIADRAYVLDDGRVIYEGSAAELGRDEERVRALAGRARRAGTRRRRDSSVRPQGKPSHALVVIPAKAGIQGHRSRLRTTPPRSRSPHCP